MYKTIVLLLTILVIGCGKQTEQNIQGDWIKGNAQEKIKITERQFRGFDMAMVETGYRYQELYWAGLDENWEYANYQVQKIKKTIVNGLERRPKRAKSAEFFLNVTLPEMEKAIQSKDTVVFNKTFKSLTNSCIDCHALEKVPHFTVKKPLYRSSSIRK